MAGEDLAEDPPAPADSDTTCSVCYAEFLEPEDLALHIRQVHAPKGSIHCKFCSLTYRSMEDYALHIRNVHILYLKACKYCTKVFTIRDRLRKHEKAHCDGRRSSLYNCSQCKGQFSNTSDLQQHEANAHDNDLDGVVLNQCLSHLSSCLNIKALNFIRSLGQSAAYICANCAYTSPSPDDYLKHLHRSECRSYACNSCCNVYRGKRGITKHYKSHKECFQIVAEEDIIKTCPKCKSNFKVHAFAEHVKSCKPIKCNLCDVILDTMDDLSRHQTEHHPMAITMTRCKFCHREFVGSTALQKHIDRKHKPEFHLYKYMCVYCNDMYFNHPKKLFCHFFSKHSDLQPYSCKICNLTFKIRKKFTIHIKMTHNSIGFVEFDTRYHVFFTDQKSENPFQPKSLFTEETHEDEIADEATGQDELLEGQTEAPTDVPTDFPTDIQTDAEEVKKSLDRQPPKIRFKKQTKLNVSKPVLDIKSEVQSEGYVTELESKSKAKIIQKKAKVAKNKKRPIDTDSDSEDEPLIKIKRKTNRQRGPVRMNKDLKVKDSKQQKRFTCNICKKYCYTFQNYNLHMSFHFKDEVKKCIKCSRQFTSKTALNKHIAEKHTTSKLTDTLKSLLERRKMGKNGVAPQLSSSERFRRTIKRVRSEPIVGNVKITEITDKTSVKNFIETFTPEEREETIKKEANLEVQSSISVKPVSGKYMKPRVIKMTKFVPKPPPTIIKLAMPVRFKPVNTEKPKLRVRVVHHYIDENEDNNVEYGQDDSDHFDYSAEISQTKNENVPEVAQEVMLETQEQEKKSVVIPHKIVIPKIPESYAKDIKIAHLLPHAPFYKIVDIKDVIDVEQPNIKQEDKTEEDIKLPGGTKLVNVNPLAHLIGNTPVEKIVGPGKKHYKPKRTTRTENFEKAIAKALMKLETAKFTKRTTKKKAQPEELDSPVQTSEEILADNSEPIEGA